ncbi:surface lipoprotein assembly modifier [Yoonia sp. SDW83-1]|uniref:surface lipoprotein assembly modifier n=1 Tax=Yoonia sp. SDW83-1 TaxID=3366945 RepID=UPI00398C66A5
MKTSRCLVLALCLLGQSAMAQTTVDIPIDEARVIATRALLAGETELALQIAQGLLQANPDDRAALLVVAAGAPRAGDAAAGRRAGARAYALSQTDTQRYEAARLTALAAANEERFTLATFWLRRALTVVPNEQERERTLADAAGLRRVNPWSTNLGFAIVPSNNVNGGADENDVDDLGGLQGNLSADALALAGVRASLNFSTQYRFYQSPRDRATVALQYQVARVRLQDEIVDNPQDRPDVEGDETVRVDAGAFATDYLQLSLGYDRAFEAGTIGLQASIGTFEYGGDPYYDFQRLRLTGAIPLSDPLVLQLSARREWQDYESTTIGEVVRTTLNAGLSYRLDSGDRISATLGSTDSDGQGPSQTFEDWSLRFGYSFAEPVGPASLSLNAGVKFADYPVFFNTTDGREDETFFYGVNIGFPDIEYAGFVPGLSIDGSQSESNVGRFTRNSLSVAFTINSAF